MGEHAAVYGRPAVIAALGLRCRVTLERRREPEPGVLLDLPALGIAASWVSWRELLGYAERARERWRSWVAEPAARPFGAVRGEDPAHLVKVALGEAAAAVGGIPPSLALSVASEIPPAGGFGSSAALAVVLVAAVLAACGEPPARARVEAIALEVERRQHGEPSGIDHGTILRGGVVAARRDAAGRLALTPLAAAPEALSALAVYDTGPAAESTGEVVGAVRRRFAGAGDELAAILDRLEEATLGLCELLVRWRDGGAALVAALGTAERCLEELGVVPPPVRELIRAVEAAGGGAKISGAGSLAGPGAGALLVAWPGPPPAELPAALARCRAVPAVLGAPGLELELEAGA